MRFRPCLAALLLLPLTPAPAQSGPALLERLRLTSVIASLDTPGSQPFHLKATIQLDAQYQSPAEQGTVELWYAATNLQRITYDFPSYHATFLETPAGNYHTADARPSPYLVRALLDLILHPLPPSFEKAKANLQKRSFGKIDLDCITVASEQQKDAQPTTYCLSPLNSDLVITFAPDGQNSVNESVGTFRNRRPTMQLVLTFSGRPAAHIKVDTLQGQAAPYPETSDTSGLTLAHPPAEIVPGSVIAGKILNKEAPIYPQSSKDKHISGTVLLHAIIGLNGKIQSVQVIGSPDDALSKSAITAVSRWSYQPYLLNGKPTEVDTTITVHYSFSSQ